MDRPQKLSRETLADMTDPESGRLLSDLGQIGDVTANENQIILERWALTTHSAILWRSNSVDALKSVSGLPFRMYPGYPNINCHSP